MGAICTVYAICPDGTRKGEEMATVYREITELTAAAQEACGAFMAECARRSLAVLITETYRSQERQNELYAQGRTTSGKIVTWTKNSRHTSRRAWDICKNVKGHEYDDATFFKACGAVAAELGITWGGSWSTPDMPHFEIDENWQMPKKEAEEMTEAERAELASLRAEVEDLKAKQPKIYHYTEAIPEWGRATVQRLLDSGVFSGASEDDLNLSEDMLRMMVICERING